MPRVARMPSPTAYERDRVGRAGPCWLAPTWSAPVTRGKNVPFIRLTTVAASGVNPVLRTPTRHTEGRAAADLLGGQLMDVVGDGERKAQ